MAFWGRGSTLECAVKLVRPERLAVARASAEELSESGCGVGSEGGFLFFAVPIITVVC